MYSDRNEIRFTLNLTVASKQKWAEMRAQSKGRPHPHTSRPAATTVTARTCGSAASDSCCQPIPTIGGPWALTDLRELALDLCESIRDFALPAMRAVANHESGFANDCAQREILYLS
jgi:hypothetical protein